MQSYCIVKQTNEANRATKIRIVEKKKVEKLAQKRFKNRNNGTKETAIDVIRIKQDKKPTTLFAFDAAFETIEE